MTLKSRIKLLINILEKSEISNLEISSFWGFRKIRLSKNKNLSKIENLQAEYSNTYSQKAEANTAIQSDKQKEMPSSYPTEQEASSEEGLSSKESLDYIKAPLVGTVYTSSKPGDPAFVSEGDIVKKGQIVCIIEAMKIFNDIEADKEGVITKVLINNEDPVEFGQELFQISNNN